MVDYPRCLTEFKPMKFSECLKLLLFVAHHVTYARHSSSVRFIVTILIVDDTVSCIIERYSISTVTIIIDINHVTIIYYALLLVRITFQDNPSLLICTHMLNRNQQRRLHCAGKQRFPSGVFKLWGNTPNQLLIVILLAQGTYYTYITCTHTYLYVFINIYLLYTNYLAHVTNPWQGINQWDGKGTSQCEEIALLHVRYV